MANPRFLLFLCLIASVPCHGQALPERSATPEPSLPVIDYNACPFEGCTFQEWIVVRDVTLFSTWRNSRKPIATVENGQVVTGLTGVHITDEPDRVQVLQPIPELELQPGDFILRYMYRGEGFADIWAGGRFRRQYDCTFITERNNAGCLRDCAARVISEGRKDWWVRVKTSKGVIGWAKVEDQFDCMDSLGGDEKCDNIGASSDPTEDKPTSIDEARLAVQSNLSTPEGKAYDQKVQAEFQKHSELIPLCKRRGIKDAESFWILLKLGNNGRVKEVLLFPTTQLGACARETLLQDSFSPPPRPGYWVGVFMKISD